MAAPIDLLGTIHRMTAEKFADMIENGVEEVKVDKDGDETVTRRALTAAEWGVITGFLKNNNITASVSDNDALKALQDKLQGKRKTIRPVLPDVGEGIQWQ